MVELVNHKYQYTIIVKDVPEARKYINRNLQYYQDYETVYKNSIFDLNTLDKIPEPETYSILVNDQIVWTNKHLF